MPQVHPSPEGHFDQMGVWTGWLANHSTQRERERGMGGEEKKEKKTDAKYIIFLMQI